MSATAPLLPTSFACSLPLDHTLALLHDIEKLGENLSSAKKSKEKREEKKKKLGGQLFQNN